MNNKKTLSQIYLFPFRAMGFLVPQSRSTKRTTATMLWRAGLMALLLGSGGVMGLPTWANSVPTLPTTQVPATQKIIYVNPTLGTDSSSLVNSEETPYRTLTYALQQAQAGTTIQLANGSYSRESGEKFPLIINSGVILRGNESTKGRNVSIVGGGSYLSRTFASQNTTILAQKDSEIRGVTITNPNTRGTGVWIESSNPTVENNTFVNSWREGIFVTGTAAPKIVNNVFTQNKANGISVARAAQGEIRGNLFQDTGFGIAISETAAPFVIDNLVIQNKDGIVISHSAHPVLRQNLIERNTRYGLVAITDAQPDLGTANDPGNNIIHNNGQYDLYNVTNSETLRTIGNEIASSGRGKVSLPVASPAIEPLQSAEPNDI